MDDYNTNSFQLAIAFQQILTNPYQHTYIASLQPQIRIPMIPFYPFYPNQFPIYPRFTPQHPLVQYSQVNLQSQIQLRTPPEAQNDQQNFKSSTHPAVETIVRPITKLENHENDEVQKIQKPARLPKLASDKNNVSSARSRPISYIENNFRKNLAKQLERTKEQLRCETLNNPSQVGKQYQLFKILHSRSITKRHWDMLQSDNRIRDNFLLDMIDLPNQISNNQNIKKERITPHLIRIPEFLFERRQALKKQLKQHKINDEEFKRIMEAYKSCEQGANNLIREL